MPREEEGEGALKSCMVMEHPGTVALSLPPPLYSSATHQVDPTVWREGERLALMGTRPALPAPRHATQGGGQGHSRKWSLILGGKPAAISTHLQPALSTPRHTRCCFSNSDTGNGLLACIPAGFASCCCCCCCSSWSCCCRCCCCWSRLRCLRLPSDPEGQPRLRLAQRTPLAMSGRSGGHEGRARSRDFGQVGEAGGLGLDRMVWVPGFPGQQRPHRLGCGGRLHSVS